MAKRGYKARPVADRFWEKVDKNGPVPPHRPELGQCWIWTAGINRQRGGYGMFALKKGVIRRSHRIAWMLTHGEPPDGIEVCHKCDNPPCVRPDHLFLGTGADNMADMIAKGRQRSVKGEQSTLSKLTETQVAEIRAERRAGVKGRVLAERYGVSISTIYHMSRDRWLHVEGATERAPARGEQAGGAIVTEVLVRWMRAEHAAGRDCADIGREVGLTRGAAWRAITGRSWKHL